MITIMRKKLGLAAIAVLLCTAVWYFFLKPHDYVVRFKIKALPGTINQSLKSWSEGLDSAKFIAQKDLSDLKYRLSFGDSTHIYHWKFESLNDSVTRVKAYVTDTTHSLANRVALIFSETDFEKRSKKTVSEFSKRLKEHLGNFKVNKISKAEIPTKYCACLALKTSQAGKAKGMMANYSYLNGLMASNQVPLDGRPIIEIENWNMQNDSIAFNFCFPVQRSDSLPQQEDIFYKQIKARPALRTLYNGNYITSDRAWYALLDYAEKEGITTEQRPLEVFHSNPNMGGDELNWEAEVFLPIQEKDN